VGPWRRLSPSRVEFVCAKLADAGISVLTLGGEVHPHASDTPPQSPWLPYCRLRC
jgi:hypothetical protein